MEYTFYDKTGSAIAYTYNDDIYLFDGTPVAYIYNNSYIYTIRGKHIGFFTDGWIIDLNGNYAFFTDNAYSGMVKPSKKVVPCKSVRKNMPIKYTREIARIKPVIRYNWSTDSGRSFFE